MRFGRWCTAALALAASPLFAQAPLERGKYLVEGILTCGNCHTPRGPKGVLDTANRHAGGPQVWDTAEYHVRPANITPDAPHLPPRTPRPYKKISPPADLDAVVAYTQSIPPVSRKVEPPVYKVK